MEVDYWGWSACKAKTVPLVKKNRHACKTQSLTQIHLPLTVYLDIYVTCVFIVYPCVVMSSSPLGPTVWYWTDLYSVYPVSECGVLNANGCYSRAGIRLWTGCGVWRGEMETWESDQKWNGNMGTGLLICPWSIFLEVDSWDAPWSQEIGTEPTQQLPHLFQQPLQ